MVYKMCPVCRQTGTGKTCDCDNSIRMSFVDKRLLNTTQKLMDLDLIVSSCRVHEMQLIKTIEIEIQFRGLYIEAIFMGAPQGWQVQLYDYDNWG
jgi:hypothetical protein